MTPSLLHCAPSSVPLPFSMWVPQASLAEDNTAQTVPPRGWTLVSGLAAPIRALAVVHAVFMLGTLGAFLTSREFRTQFVPRPLWLSAVPSAMPTSALRVSQGPLSGVLVPPAAWPRAEAVSAAAARHAHSRRGALVTRGPGADAAPPSRPVRLLPLSIVAVAVAVAYAARQALRGGAAPPPVALAAATGKKAAPAQTADPFAAIEPLKAPDREGPSSDVRLLFSRFIDLAAPYWRKESNPDARSAQLQLAALVVATLLTTGISVGFSYLGRDFFNYLSQKDVEGFWRQLKIYLVAIPCGIPVFVFRDFYSAKLKVEWRQWLTERLIAQYLDGRSFYRIQTGSLMDNPDQRIASDVSKFTATTLGFFFTILNSTTDLVAFSGILFSIYPPLFLVLIAYAIAGTLISIRLGQPLVGLNFEKEKREANFRYSLVRIRENAESIAFFGGERNEATTLRQLLGRAIDNVFSIMITKRNLGFFQSYYQYLIGLLPAAVIAPLYFKGEVEFGVINQSASAFNHILGDVSLVVTQFSAIAGFAAVVDRLGEFGEVMAASSDRAPASAAAEGRPRGGAAHATGDGITITGAPSGGALLSTKGLCLRTPDSKTRLVQGLDLTVESGGSVLLMGPSGSGKTSLLRALAGLWSTGEGEIARAVSDPAHQYHELFFVPQRPYMVLGTLRKQLLYPTWTEPAAAAAGAAAASAFPSSTDPPSAPLADSAARTQVWLGGCLVGRTRKRPARSNRRIRAGKDGLPTALCVHGNTCALRAHLVLEHISCSQKIKM